MITAERIERAKQVPIEKYLLLAKGIKAERTLGNQLVYRSPLKDETNASFFVHVGRNVFNDFSTTDQRGDVIRLVCLLEGCSFQKAVELLESLDGQTVFSSLAAQKSSTSHEPLLEVLKLKPLENKALIEYLTIKRGIAFDVGKVYLKECYFTLNGKRQFALAFENDLKGLELRSVYCKLCTSPKAITTLKGIDNTAAIIFEGFMDFLSYVTLQGQKPNCDAIILNSTVNLPMALQKLKSCQYVWGYLDNDKTGQEATEKIQALGVMLFDCRSLFSPYKDVNEYLTHHPKKPVV